MHFKKNIKTREIALQIIYSFIISKCNNIKSKIKEFKLINKKIFKKIDKKYLKNILSWIKKKKKYINKIINKNLKKKKRYIGLIKISVLNIAIYELKKNKKLDKKIIINESIKLIKKFGSQNDYKLINKILHKICFKNYKYNFLNKKKKKWN